MARPRRTTTAKRKATASAGKFKCPECGKTFGRAASLGAHRNRAHGVTGASKRRTRAAGSGPAASITKTIRQRRGQNSGSGINRDELLQALFPGGVPPREDVIRRVGSWLDEAEQLAKL
jgi:uncharacterized C2H2 Zn-finger protein